MGLRARDIPSINNNNNLRNIKNLVIKGSEISFIANFKLLRQNSSKGQQVEVQQMIKITKKVIKAE